MRPPIGVNKGYVFAAGPRAGGASRPPRCRVADNVVRYVLRKGYTVQTDITMLHSYIRTRVQATGRSRTHAHTRAALVLAAGVG